MKRWFYPLLGCLVLMLAVLVVGDVLAETANSAPASSNGQVGLSYVENLYCATKQLVHGNVGLIVGILMAALGVWMLIEGQALTSSLVLIVCGALITAVPGLVESTLGGLGTLLNEAKITTTKKNAFASPKACASSTALDKWVPAAPNLYQETGSTSEDDDDDDDSGFY